jgi:1-acyl-sn-glycerol-3-phosphate acyltransferase
VHHARRAAWRRERQEGVVMGEQPGVPLRLDWRWHVLAALLVPWFVLARWRIDVQGLEHVPSEGGAVVAFNHHSYADAIMLAWGIVLRARRPLRYLAKREAVDGRWIGWVTRWISVIPVDRGSSGARANALTEARVALESGDLVAIAPEQTISDSLELLPFRHGAARLAIAAGVPVIPCLGWGSQRFVGPDRRLARVFRLPVTVRFGAPVTPRPDEDAAAFTQRLREHMAAILDDVQHDYPDGLPAGAHWVPARLGGGAPPHDRVLAEHAERMAAWGERWEAQDGPRPGAEAGSTDAADSTDSIGRTDAADAADVGDADGAGDATPGRPEKDDA